MSETDLWGGLGEVGRAVRCSLACDRGLRVGAPSVAVFQCSFSLGTSVGELNAVLYVICECLQNRECECVCARVQREL